MNKPFFPNVTLPASDHRRLERLAQAGADQGDVDARFLLREINRAEVVPDRAARLDSIVTMGSWVTFWITWGFPRETRQLVYSEDYTSERTQIPVMSPLGAALVGLKVGSEIPFFTAGRTNVVKIELSAEVIRMMLSGFCLAIRRSRARSSLMTMIRDHRPLRKGEKVMSKTNRKGKPEIVLPPIAVIEDEARRLNALASSSAVLFPRVAHFLAQEIERASVVADNSDLRGVVRMGSQVRYCDDKTVKSGTWYWFIPTKRT
ncbi:GreA/GreB family elongation factor [Bradyrhizobium sp. 153]|uniref:GreA/GreB family elongation factor n=1 Tax=unclassified Bradyrhizobium TaxID=2631580 RepID=UPI0031F996C6